MASSADGATRRRRSVARASMRLGDSKRVDFEAQLVAGFFFGGALAVQLLDLVAVAQQLEVLPRREEQHDDQKRRHAGRLPELALPRLVDLAHDRVVADVLLDGVLERLHMALRHGLKAVPSRLKCVVPLSTVCRDRPSGWSDMRSAARSFALRARGLRADFFLARHQRLLRQHLHSRSPPRSSARSVCFTMRSSSE